MSTALSVIKKGLLYLLVGFGGLLIITTLLSLLYSTSLWFLQDLNFPRLQTLVLLLVCEVLFLFSVSHKKLPALLFTISLLSCICIQAYIIYPYSPLGIKKIATADAGMLDTTSECSIMLANVLMPNRQLAGLLQQIKEEKPTFLLTMEVDNWWIEQLSVLKKDYSYQISFPTNNTYGMALYSKLPLINQRIQFLNHDSVPSFQGDVMMPNGNRFHLFTIHPVAPKSSEHHPDNTSNTEVALPLVAKLWQMKNCR